MNQLPEKFIVRGDGSMNGTESIINDLIDYLEEQGRENEERWEDLALSMIANERLNEKDEVESESRSDRYGTTTTHTQGVEKNPMIPVGGIIKIGTIQIPKPEWWENSIATNERFAFKEALEACSRASGITFYLQK